MSLYYRKSTKPISKNQSSIVKNNTSAAKNDISPFTQSTQSYLGPIIILCCFLVLCIYLIWYFRHKRLIDIELIIKTYLSEYQSTVWKQINSLKKTAQKDILIPVSVTSMIYSILDMLLHINYLSNEKIEFTNNTKFINLQTIQKSIEDVIKECNMPNDKNQNNIEDYTPYTILLRLQEIFKIIENKEITEESLKAMLKEQFDQIGLFKTIFIFYYILQTEDDLSTLLKFNEIKDQTLNEISVQQYLSSDKQSIYTKIILLIQRRWETIYTSIKTSIIKPKKWLKIIKNINNISMILNDPQCIVSINTKNKKNQ